MFRMIPKPAQSQIIRQLSQEASKEAAKTVDTAYKYNNKEVFMFFCVGVFAGFTLADSLSTYPRRKQGW